MNFCQYIDLFHMFSSYLITEILILKCLYWGSSISVQTSKKNVWNNKYMEGPNKHWGD